MYERLASAIYNNIVNGLAGFHQTSNISIEQILDDIVAERLALIKEYTLKGVIPENDLMVSLDCIKTDKKSLSNCTCFGVNDQTIHFEIPQIALDYGLNAISYIGGIDRNSPFIYYTSPQLMKYNKYRKSGTLKPYIYINPTPNSNKFNDGYVFNAPLLRVVSVRFIPKDPSQLLLFEIDPESLSNYNFIDSEIVKRVTEKYIRYFKQMALLQTPNTQAPA